MESRQFLGTLAAVLLYVHDGNGNAVPVQQSDLVGGSGGGTGQAPESLRLVTLHLSGNTPVGLSAGTISGVEGLAVAATVYVEGGAIRASVTNGYGPGQNPPAGPLWPDGSVFVLESALELQHFRAVPAVAGEEVSLHIDARGVRVAPPFGGAQ